MMQRQPASGPFVGLITSFAGGISGQLPQTVGAGNEALIARVEPGGAQLDRASGILIVQAKIATAGLAGVVRLDAVNPQTGLVEESTGLGGLYLPSDGEVAAVPLSFGLLLPRLFPWRFDFVLAAQVDTDVSAAVGRFWGYR